jgi:hypothetical protein
MIINLALNQTAIVGHPVERDPWPHMVVKDVFGVVTYQQMLANLPDPNAMPALGRSTTRSLYWLKGPRDEEPPITPFWGGLRETLFPDLRSLLEVEFGVRASYWGAELVHDKPGYYLGPHTDTPDRLLTCVFYLAATLDHPGPGTTLYSCPTPDPRGKGHRPGPEFKEVVTLPYRPNTGLIFLRTDISYHGVKVVHKPRWSLAFDLFK